MADDLVGRAPTSRNVAVVTPWFPDAAVLRRRGRCADLHDDHRERPGHSTRQHNHRRRRGQLWPGTAVPAARARRPLDAARVCLSAVPSRQTYHRRRPAAARSDPGSDRAWCRLPHRHARSRRSGVSATCWGRSRPVISAPWATRRTWSSSRRRSRSCAAAGARSRSIPRSACRSRRSCPRATCPRSASASCSTSASSSAPDEMDLERIRDELLDRYGPLPAEAENLLEVIRLKLLAKALGLPGHRRRRRRARAAHGGRLARRPGAARRSAERPQRRE